MESFNPNKGISELVLPLSAKKALASIGCETVADLLLRKPCELLSLGKLVEQTYINTLFLHFKLSYDSSLVPKLTPSESTQAGDNNPPRTFTYNGVTRIDIPIAEMDFSGRAKNALARENFSFLSEIINMSREDILRLPTPGGKTASEVADYLNKYRQEPIKVPELIMTGEVQARTLQEIEEYFQRELSKMGCPPNPSIYAVRSALIKTIPANHKLDLEARRLDHEFIQLILSDTLIGKFIKEFLIEIIKPHLAGISLLTLLSDLPQIIPEHYVEALLDEITVEQVIVMEDGLYCIKRHRFMEAIAQRFDERTTMIIKLRIAGKTLSHIAGTLRISGEAVRQIEIRAIRKVEDLYEDRYRSFFEEYNVTKEEFMAMFNESEEAYYYLSHKYTRGHKPITKIFEVG